MCGIAGFIYPQNTERPQWARVETLKAMLKTIHHRGPDGQGEDLHDGYAFGHVRLSILDTSKAAHQPMLCPHERYSLTYNGEIYNYKAIRKTLEARGYNFRSDGDTEVLLYALIEWGADCFAKLEGMFAGAFHDKQKRDYRSHGKSASKWAAKFW